MTQKAGRRPPSRPRSDDARQTPDFNADESPLAWLARRKDKLGQPLISEQEFAAGERLRRDFTLAQMSPRITTNWSGLLTGGGGRVNPTDVLDVREAVIEAEARVRSALAAAGPDLSGILIDVCCLLRGLEVSEKSGGWPQRSGKVVLQIALRQLARHYGIIRDDGARNASAASGVCAQSNRVSGEAGRPLAARVNHWGTADYRPRISPDSS